MNVSRFALLSFAAVVLAGCSPKNPPSGYDDETVSFPQVADEQIVDATPTESTLPARGATASKNQFDSETGRYKTVMGSVQFGFDKYGVSQAERAKLKSVAEKAKSTQIVVVGYTDYFGTDQYNLALSDRRAQSVKKCLVELGVPPENIETQGRGKQFAKQGGTKAEVAEDRRADIADLNAGGK